MDGQHSKQNPVYVNTEKLLVDGSDLFERGELSDSTPPDAFLHRLNTRAGRARRDLTKNIPSAFPDAIKADGKLKPHAELIVFGTWLIVDGHPGMKRRPGKQPDLRDVLKCVAAIILAHKARKKRKAVKAEDKPVPVSTARARRKQEISKHDIAEYWKLAFEDDVKPSSIDSRLKSVKRILPFYLDYLSSGKAQHTGKRISGSPEIRNAWHAISTVEPDVQNQYDEMFAEPETVQPAKLDPFEVPLRYQSENHEVDYRNQVAGTGGKTRLRYVTQTAEPTSKTGSVRATRKDKITLRPDIKIKDNYRATALIDRMVILVELSRAVSSTRLSGIISKKTRASPFVLDLTDHRKEPSKWGVPIMELDAKKLTGHPYAISIQDPTSDLLSDVLQVLSADVGIVPPVLVHLVEVSVDFYPRDAGLSAAERILLRERMVGMLQRHHWIRAAELHDPELPVPRDTDPRQLLSCDAKDPDSHSKTRFLFAKHKKRDNGDTKKSSDADLAQAGIRKRVLTTRPGYDLCLNSTLVKGGRYSPVHVSIQHKIADARNPEKSTMTMLNDDERRARIEVTLSGTQMLQERGLNTVNDLGTTSFRNLTKGTLTFKLPEIAPFEHLMEDAKAQLRTRGVYGIDLRTRALYLENREATRRSGQKVPRNEEREGMALKDWKEMNTLVGNALDGLTRRWEGFTAP